MLSWVHLPALPEGLVDYLALTLLFFSSSFRTLLLLRPTLETRRTTEPLGDRIANIVVAFLYLAIPGIVVFVTWFGYAILLVGVVAFGSIWLVTIWGFRWVRRRTARSATLSDIELERVRDARSAELLRSVGWIVKMSALAIAPFLIFLALWFANNATRPL